VFVRGIAGQFAAVVVLALSLGCEDTPHAPTADGPPFFTVTTGGVQWLPDQVDPFLDPAGLVTLRARRNTDDGGSEILNIFLLTSDAFSLASYRLDGDDPGESAAQFAQWAGPSDSPDLLAWFVTSGTHTGALRITGANTADSVVSGVFAFEGEDRLTHEVRQFRGEFRVRYTTTGL
jgi:hypothetical protein